MIRYVASFPGNLNADQAHAISARLKAAADSREARDIVIANGGTIVEMGRPKPVAALVRRARARAR